MIEADQIEDVDMIEADRIEDVDGILDVNLRQFWISGSKTLTIIPNFYRKS
jgi:hypothetical protein